MKRIFLIIPILLIALLGLAEVAQPEIEMREVRLMSFPQNPQCTFYRATSDANSDDPLLIAYHHGAERVLVGQVKLHITSFSRFSESVVDGEHFWAAGAGRRLSLKVYSKSWTSRFFGYALRLELSEKSKDEEQVSYAGTMRVKHRFKSEIIDITGRCEA